MPHSRTMNSPYLAGTAISKAPVDRCYYCGVTMHFVRPAHGVPKATMATVDHIRPSYMVRKNGPLHHEAMLMRHNGITNKRPCCYRCNQMRGMANHCTAILMISLMERKLSLRHLTQTLKMLLPPDQVTRKDRLAEKKERRRKGKAAMRSQAEAAAAYNSMLP